MGIRSLLSLHISSGTVSLFLWICCSDRSYRNRSAFPACPLKHKFQQLPQLSHSLYQPGSNGKIFESCAPTVPISPGVTTLCKHNMYRLLTGPEWTCQAQVVSFAPSQLHRSATDFPTLTSPKSDLKQGRASYGNSFLYIIIFYLVRALNNIYFISSYDPALGPERSGGMSCLASLI
jgi:hypothetical protein